MFCVILFMPQVLAQQTYFLFPPPSPSFLRLKQTASKRYLFQKYDFSIIEPMCSQQIGTMCPFICINVTMHTTLSQCAFKEEKKLTRFSIMSQCALNKHKWANVPFHVHQCNYAYNNKPMCLQRKGNTKG